MVINKRIAVDLANRFPASFIVMSHSMNVQTFNVVIALYNEGEALSIDSGATVTATLVSGGYLVCTDRACTYDNNEITVDITNEVGHTSNIPAGELQIEICVKSGNTELYIPYISAYISKSIQDDAAVTPTSYGTVAAAVAEVAAARGTFVTLAAALANKLDDANGEIMPRHIASLAVTGAKIAYSAVTASKIATGAIGENHLSDELKEILPKVTVWDYATSQANNFIVPSSFDGKVGDIVIVSMGTGTGGRVFQCTRIISQYGSTTRKWERTNDKINADTGAVLNSYIADGAVTSAKIAASAIITSLIADNAVTFDKLATALQNRITSIETTNTSQSSRIATLENTVGTINNDMQSVLTGGV